MMDNNNFVVLVFNLLIVTLYAMPELHGLAQQWLCFSVISVCTQTYTVTFIQNWSHLLFLIKCPIEWIAGNKVCFSL